MVWCCSSCTLTSLSCFNLLPPLLRMVSCCAAVTVFSDWLYLVIAESAAHLFAIHVLIQCDLPQGLIALNDLRRSLCNLLCIGWPGNEINSSSSSSSVVVPVFALTHEGSLQDATHIDTRFRCRKRCWHTCSEE